MMWHVRENPCGGIAALEKSASRYHHAPGTARGCGAQFRAVIIILVLACVGADIRCARAGEDPPATLGGKYGLEADLAGQSKPAALDLSIGPWYRYIYHADNSRLWNGLYVKGGSLLSLNPAYGQLGIYVEWMPISILQLRAQFDRFSFFGRDGSLLSYNDKNEHYGYRDLRRRRGQEISGEADRWMIQPTLRGEYGRYVVENDATYAFYRYEQTGPYFWDQEYDTLLQKQDRLFADDVYILYNCPPDERYEKLLVGPSFEVVRAYGANLTRERLGVSLYYEPVPGKSILGYTQHPRFYFQAGLNTKDRNQDDQFYFLGGIGTELNFD